MSLHLPKVAVVNRATVLSDDAVKAMTAALQLQVSDDFAPAWGVDAMVSFFTRGESVPADWWQLVIADNSDQAGALGYHERDARGLPIGFVFANTDRQYGLESSVTASHELLEMLADPWICAAAFKQLSAIAGQVYALEVCDPVEADDLGYAIAGVQVSDFVLPDWFVDDATKGPFDFRAHLKAPFSLAPGGYASIFDKGWIQATSDSAPTRRQLARRQRGLFSRTQHRINRKGT